MYDISDVAEDLTDLGHARRARSTAAHNHNWEARHDPEAHNGGEYLHSHWVSPVSDLGHARRVLAAQPHVTRGDLVNALEEALMSDGDRRRAFAVLALARDEDWATRELFRARHRG